ncbi:MAG TPA: hypothetical protein VFA82_03030 [Gaiellaceae bacterium]|nr:hypothetical protein [Gaiellaceae bacterium]
MLRHSIHFHAEKPDENATATRVECALCREQAVHADSKGVGYCAEHYRQVHPERVRRLVAAAAHRAPARHAALR